MRKRKKPSKKNEMPLLDAALDKAGGYAMSKIAAVMEEKYHYTERGKINPYAVSAVGIAHGKFKSTSSIISTGGVLGALGSFDLEPVSRSRPKSYVPDDPVFDEINYTVTNDNRYAWRLNCEDGTAYGVYPEDYETRGEYNEALRAVKSAVDKD